MRQSDLLCIVRRLRPALKAAGSTAAMAERCTAGAPAIHLLARTAAA